MSCVAVRIVTAFFLSWEAVFLYATEVNTIPVRVAVLLKAPTFDKALGTLSCREYQGVIRVLKNREGGYDAINIINLEDFLLWVVGQEMSPKGPLEALKAQAIAARSHALYQISVSNDQPFDLIANLSQAYAGKTKLHKNLVLALESTRGQVLYYQSRPIPAYFHTSCGGRTEIATNVWPISRRTSGKGEFEMPNAVLCPFCAASTENKWRFEISAAALRRVFHQHGYRIGATPSIHLIEKVPGGRVQTVAIRSENGEILLPAEKLRAFLGYSNLRSTLFEVCHPAGADGMFGNQFVFQGDGYGHGVGLCQFGAEEMAVEGATYETILTHYFPECRIGPYPLLTIAGKRKAEVER